MTNALMARDTKKTKNNKLLFIIFQFKMNPTKEKKVVAASFKF